MKVKKENTFKHKPLKKCVFFFWITKLVRLVLVSQLGRRLLILYFLLLLRLRLVWCNKKLSQFHKSMMVWLTHLIEPEKPLVDWQLHNLSPSKVEMPVAVLHSFTLFKKQVFKLQLFSDLNDVRIIYTHADPRLKHITTTETENPRLPPTFCYQSIALYDTLGPWHWTLDCWWWGVS